MFLIKIDRTIHFFKKEAIKLFLLGAMAFFLFLVTPALFQAHHFFYNLEPYPDGLLYSLSARNFVFTGDFALSYNGSILSHWAPPFYSASLILAYLISTNPSGFILMNVFFVLLCYFFLSLSVYERTQDWKVIAICSLVFFGHAYIWWIPLLPMAENLILFLFSLSMYGLFTHKKTSLKLVTLVIIPSLLLLLTKYSMILISICLICIGLFLYRKLLSKKIWILGIFLCISVPTILTTLVENPFSVALSFFESLGSANSSYFSLHFLTTNIEEYTRTLFSDQGKFLWQTTPLSSIFIFLGFLFSLTWLHLKSLDKRSKFDSFILLILFLSQFPLLLIFYVVDARYIIFSIPIFAMAIGLATAQIRQTHFFPYFLGLLSLFMIGHFTTQLPIFREIVAANILGRSTGWQYEAIRHFDATFPTATEDTFIFTALPPFLVDAYTLSNYRVLPLSPHQEFLAKGQWVWGSDVTPAFTAPDLHTLASDLLAEGKEVYISNAYITHLHEVTTDYELFLSSFETEQVSEGCLQTCNLYALKPLE